MYLYDIIKFFCVFVYNYFLYLNPLLLLVFIRYSHLIFLCVLIIYNLSIVFCTDDISFVDLNQLENHLSHLPNYLKFNTFLNINDFLYTPAYGHTFVYDEMEYMRWADSLYEIDYLVTEDSSKPMLYQTWKTWDDLVGLPEQNYKNWQHNYDLIMEQDRGNYTHEFEKYFLKYVCNDTYIKNHAPVKYTTWRYMESVRIKLYLHEYKKSTIDYNKWDWLLQSVQQRLHSKRKCGYLFRSHDTYLYWFYKYQFYLQANWANAILKRYRWIVRTRYLRKPWVMFTIFFTKCLGGAGLIYLWFQYSPFP